MTIFYHRTEADSAEKILRDGFRDSTGYYGTTREHKGVWLSNTPFDENEGAKGDTLLLVELSEQAVSNYEWITEGCAYREWHVPAQLINEQGKVSKVDEDGGARVQSTAIPRCTR